MNLRFSDGTPYFIIMIIDEIHDEGGSEMRIIKEGFYAEIKIETTVKGVSSSEEYFANREDALWIINKLKSVFDL